MNPMPLTTEPFDIAEQLKTPEEIRSFLQEVAATGDESDLLHALNIAVKAVGMTEVAQRAGMTRASLYKSLSGQSNPKFLTISKVTKALGCKLAVV